MNTTLFPASPISDMPEPFELTLDGHSVMAFPGETLWQVAKREGRRFPICVSRTLTVIAPMVIAEPV